MSYDSFGIIIVFFLLLYFSFIDIKYKQITNDELIPILVVVICSVVYKIAIGATFSIFLILFFLCGVVAGVFFYWVGFLGGADLKLIIFLLMVMDPTRSYGITPNWDGIQFMYYFLVCLLTSLLIRCVSNVTILLHAKQIKIISNNRYETISLCIFYKLRNWNTLTSTKLIVLRINTSQINVYLTFRGIICWSSQQLPMVPFIAISLFLTLFT